MDKFLHVEAGDVGPLLVVRSEYPTRGGSAKLELELVQTMQGVLAKMVSFVSIHLPCGIHGVEDV